MRNEDAELAGLIGVFAVLFLTFIFFIVFLLILYRLLRLIWARLPVSVINLQGSDLDKLFGIVIALAIASDVPRYGWNTLNSVLDFVAGQIRRIAGGSFAGPSRCEEFNRCASEVAAQISAIFGDTALGLVRALRLVDFPILQFVLFLIIAVVATQIFSVIRHGILTRQLRGWVSTADHWFPAATRQRVVFALLVVVAFYLGLSALLAIPLFQDKTRPQNLSVESLDLAIEPNVLSADAFARNFAVELPSIREPIRGAKAPGYVGGGVLGPEELLEQVMRNHGTMRQDIQFDWTALRESALSDQVRLRAQVRTAFASGLDSGIGRKQISEHYFDLVNWHQNSMQLAIESLRVCWARATAFLATAAEFQDNLVLVAQSTAIDNLAFRDSYLQSGVSRTQESFSQALRACRPDAASRRNTLPTRKSFADSLGPIGRWSRWLLETEQMPVVIIVGLVGFSLLGATVSRVVRAHDAGPKGTLTLDDLLIVIAGGTTAAIVVFLAAYGGLAVLGGSTGDPNPYVLFATCLIGAVYSEDVWTWARRRLLTSATRASGRTDAKKQSDRKRGRKKG